MDNKQKLNLYKKANIIFMLTTLSFICWFVYSSIISIINNSNFLWIDICLIIISLFFLIYTISLLTFLKLRKNLYNLSNIFLIIIGIIFLLSIIIYIIDALHLFGIFKIGDYFSVPIIFLAIPCLTSLIINFICVQIYTLSINTCVHSNNAEDLSFDNEIELRKQIEELNRKKEIKKLSDEIENLKIELGEK